MIRQTSVHAYALDRLRPVVGAGLHAEDVPSTDAKRFVGSAGAALKAVQMLNVCSHQHGLCLSFPADAKTNEITHVPGLLDTLLLDLAGCTVTVDVLNTLPVKDKAEYTKVLKGHQGTSLEDVTWRFEQADREHLESSFETHERPRSE